MTSNIPETSSSKDGQHENFSKTIDPFFDLFNDVEEDSSQAFLENPPGDHPEQSAEYRPGSLHGDDASIGDLREPNEYLEQISRNETTAVTDTSSIPRPAPSFLLPSSPAQEEETTIAGDVQAEALSEEGSDDESEPEIDLAQGFRPIGASLGNSKIDIQGFQQQDHPSGREPAGHIFETIPSPEYLDDLDLREHATSFGRHFFPWEVPGTRLDNEPNNLLPQTPPIEPERLQMNGSQHLAFVYPSQGQQTLEDVSSSHLLLNSPGTKRKRNDDKQDEAWTAKRKVSGEESDLSFFTDSNLDKAETSFSPALSITGKTQDDSGFQEGEELQNGNGSRAQGTSLDDCGFQDGSSSLIRYHVDEAFKENVVPQPQQYFGNTGYGQLQLGGQTQGGPHDDGLGRSSYDNAPLLNSGQQNVPVHVYEQPSGDMVLGSVALSLDRPQSNHISDEFRVQQHPHDLSVCELFWEQYERGDATYGEDLFANWQGNDNSERHLRESFRLFPGPSPNKIGRKKLRDENGKVVKSELTDEDLDYLDFLPRYLDFPTLNGTNHEHYALWGADMRRDIIPRSVNHQQYYIIDRNGNEVYDWKETVSHIQRAHSNARQRYRDDALGGFLPRFRTAESKRFTEYLTPMLPKPDGINSRRLLPMENLLLGTRLDIDIERMVMVHPKTGLELPLFNPQDIPSNVRDELMQRGYTVPSLEDLYQKYPYLRYYREERHPLLPRVRDAEARLQQEAVNAALRQGSSRPPTRVTMSKLSKPRTGKKGNTEQSTKRKADAYDGQDEPSVTKVLTTEGFQGITGGQPQLPQVTAHSSNIVARAPQKAVPAAGHSANPWQARQTQIEADGISLRNQYGQKPIPQQQVLHPGNPMNVRQVHRTQMEANEESSRRELSQMPLPPSQPRRTPQHRNSANTQQVPGSRMEADEQRLRREFATAIPQRQIATYSSYTRPEEYLQQSQEVYSSGMQQIMGQRATQRSNATGQYYMQQPHTGVPAHQMQGYQQLNLQSPPRSHQRQVQQRSQFQQHPQVQPQLVTQTNLSSGQFVHPSSVSTREQQQIEWIPRSPLPNAVANSGNWGSNDRYETQPADQDPYGTSDSQFGSQSVHHGFQGDNDDQSKRTLGFSSGNDLEALSGSWPRNDESNSTINSQFGAPLQCTEIDWDFIVHGPTPSGHSQVNQQSADSGHNNQVHASQQQPAEYTSSGVDINAYGHGQQHVPLTQGHEGMFNRGVETPTSHAAQEHPSSGDFFGFETIAGQPEGLEMSTRQNSSRAQRMPEEPNMAATLRIHSLEGDRNTQVSKQPTNSHASLSNTHSQQIHDTGDATENGHPMAPAPQFTAPYSPVEEGARPRHRELLPDGQENTGRVESNVVEPSLIGNPDINLDGLGDFLAQYDPRG